MRPRLMHTFVQRTLRLHSCIGLENTLFGESFNRVLGNLDLIGILVCETFNHVFEWPLTFVYLPLVSVSVTSKFSLANPSIIPSMHLASMGLYSISLLCQAVLGFSLKIVQCVSSVTRDEAWYEITLIIQFCQGKEEVWS